MTPLLARLVESELSIVQAPMAGVQGAALAIAASNAGALGSLPCAMLDHAALHDELTALAARASGPYNVNFFCHDTPAFDPARDDRWRTALAPFYAEYGLEPAEPSRMPGRLPFDHSIADVVEPFRPSVVSFHFGLPAPDLVARVRSWGAKVLASATTVDEARWLEQHGVDAIIAQGLEAGGHRGMFLSSDVSTQVGTFALVPQVVQAVRVPVIAAGGVADARGVAAAMALGAAGVQVGTSYLCSPEATTSPVHRNALAAATAANTALTNVFTGRPARSIINRIVRELGPMHPDVPAFPLAVAPLARLRAAAEARGLGDFSPLWAGQHASSCVERSAADITGALADGLA